MTKFRSSEDYFQDLFKRIDTMEEITDNKDKENKRRSRKRNFKFILLVIKAILPSILGITILVSGVSIVKGKNPFKKQMVDVKPYSRFEFDSDGKELETVQDKSFSKDENTVIIETGWQKEGQYYQKQQYYYAFNDIDEATLERMLEKDFNYEDNENFVLFNVVTTEKTTLDESEMEEKPKVTVEMYTQDGSKVYQRIETTFAVSLRGGGLICLGLIFGGLVVLSRFSKYKRQWQDIKNECEFITANEVEEMKKSLKMRKQLYNYLMEDE